MIRASLAISRLYRSLLFIQILFLASNICYAELDIDKVVSEMTLEEKVGQIFVFGFKNKTYDSSLKYFLNSSKPGGLLFFSRNGRSPQSVAKLISDIKLHYKSQIHLEPFFMVDHEGGDVVRVGPSLFFPSALSIGQTGDTELAKELGAATGKYLKTIGFEVNFAPVVDLRSDDKVNFIGERSFGSSPANVVKMAKPLTAGLISAGVMPVLKHFPGHGRTTQDSHFEVVRKISAEDETINEDLLPFHDMISVYPKIGVMSSHMSVPSLDPSGELTTFSTKILSKLTDEYQHKGLRFTDDLDMLFFKNRKFNIGQKVIDALNAGHDQILIIWSRANQQAAYNSVIKALKEGQLSEDLINEKVKKILLTKARLKAKTSSFSTEAIKSSLAKIYSIQTKIVQKHFNRLPSSLFQEIADFNKDNKSSYLFTFSNSFAKNFKANFKNGKYIPLAMNNWNYYLKNCKDHLCYFHISGDTSNKKLKLVPKEILPHLYILNTTDPILTDSLPSKKINIYGVNKNLWKWLSFKLKEIKASVALN